MSITNVALPTLAREFDVGPGGVAWVVLAYNLPLVALLLPLGRWVDALDKCGAFLVAVLGFAVASAICGVAPSLPSTHREGGGGIGDRDLWPISADRCWREVMFV